jgi:hypothetical protein
LTETSTEIPLISFFFSFSLDNDQRYEAEILPWTNPPHSENEFHTLNFRIPSLYDSQTLLSVEIGENRYTTLLKDAEEKSKGIPALRKLRQARRFAFCQDFYEKVCI